MRFSIDAREKILNSFKTNIFALKTQTPEPISYPTVIYTYKQTKISKHKTSPFNFNENFMNKIRNDEKKYK